MGGPQIVVLILHQHDGLSHIPAFQLVGAGADGMAEEVGFLHILPLEKMGRQDGHGHILQEGHIGLSQPEGNGQVVGGGNFHHVLIVGGILGAVFRVHDGLDGEFHVLGGKRLPVVPGNARTDVEGISAGIGIVVPAFRQARHHLILGIVGGETVEQQQVDLAMLVHGRVDAGVVDASVDQGRRLARFGPGYGGVRGVAGSGGLAAGRQGQQQDCRQKKRKNTLHRVLPNCFSVLCHRRSFGASLPGG